MKAVRTFHKYKMVFSDIDGTLLNSSHQVPGPTRRKILELEREGVPFVLVSARMPEGMTTIQAMIGCRAPMVCYSGALVRDEDGKTMYSCQMDLDLAVRIKDLIGKEFPEICCNTYGGSRWVVDDDSSPWVRKEEEITGLKAMNGDIREVFAADRGVHKFLLMGQEKAVQGLEKRLKEHFPDLSVASSSPVYLEVMDGRVSKSRGVGFLCSHYGIGLDQVIAFGDGCNDMDMLRAVKNSYAMANAPLVVRRSAAHVTLDNDHQGLLAALEENFK